MNSLSEVDFVLAALRRYLEAWKAGRDEDDAMSHLNAVTSQLPVDRLELWERNLRNVRGEFEDWQDADRVKSTNQQTRVVSWLDVCTHNGFRRERLLRTWTEGAPNAFVCALMIRRLNDWVSQVRAAARETLPQVTARSKPEDVGEALWRTLADCSTWGRIEPEDQAALGDLIALDEVALALKSRIATATAGPAAQVLNQAGRTSVFDRWFKELAQSAVQPAARARAWRFLFEGKVTWTVGHRWQWTDRKWCKGRFEPIIAERSLSVEEEILASLETASDDRSPQVRRVAADAFISQFRSIRGDTSCFIERLESDSCRYIAECGRYARMIQGGQI